MRTALALALGVLLAVPDGARAQSMTRAQWSSRMQEVMPAAFCQEGTYFRACFAQGAAACVAAAERAVGACLQRYDAQMPATFATREESGRWGQVIGACAGTLFESRDLKRKRNTPKCNDPKAWQ